MELVDGLEETVDFVAGFGEVVGEELGGFVTALDLRLQVFDCAVDVTDTADFRRAGLLEGFNLVFELRDKC